MQNQRENQSDDGKNSIVAVNSEDEEKATNIKSLEKTVRTSYDLSGYQVKGYPEYFSFQNKRFKRVRYQGVHEGEYTIYQMKGGVKHGPAQLFEYNMLKMAWEMENGKQVGELRLYECGKVYRYTRWENIHEDKVRWVVNGENGLYLEIEDVKNGTIIYRGEYNSTTFEREGYE